MLNTKLIIIDGMTGSGKSTTAHFIARQLAKNNLKVKWLHEEEADHPLIYKPAVPVTDEQIKLSDAQKQEKYLQDYPKQWQKFAGEALSFDGVYIIESYLFQYTLMHLIRYELENDQVKSFLHNIINLLSELNPVVIAFYQQDVPAALNLNWNRRGEGWKKWYLDRVGNGNYARSRNLDGETAAYQIWQRLTDLSLAIMDEFKIRKLLIENSTQQWDCFRQQILTFLELPYFEEEHLRPSDERFCGEYNLKFSDEEHGSGEINYKVYIADNRLCLDAFWPNLKLLPKSDNEFEIEGFPFGFRFNLDEDGSSRSMEVVQSTFFFEPGMKLEKIS